MNKKYENVMQFKIALLDIKPQIWRRIQVPENYSFWDLHCAIQDAMGWHDSHLHEFTDKKPYSRQRPNVTIGLPEEDEHLHSKDIMIAPFFSKPKNKMYYLYDFGDSWMHEVVLEEILPRETGKKYPLCLDGKRACPPEDCGGEPGYYRILELMKTPKDEEYKDMIRWLGGKYDPEDFDPKKVRFTDSQKRLKNLLY